LFSYPHKTDKFTVWAERRIGDVKPGGLRDERRLSVFENRVLRCIFGSKRGEVTGEWRKLHKEELNDLYCSPNIVRMIRLRKMLIGGACSAYGEE